MLAIDLYPRAEARGNKSRLKKIPTWSVILGVVLLCGILSMTYGYYHNSEVALYAGLAVTMVGALPAAISKERRIQ
jgi:hypothetical protein